MSFNALAGGVCGLLCGTHLVAALVASSAALGHLNIAIFQLLPFAHLADQADVSEKGPQVNIFVVWSDLLQLVVVDKNRPRPH